MSDVVMGRTFSFLNFFALSLLFILSFNISLVHGFSFFSLYFRKASASASASVSSSLSTSTSTSTSTLSTVSPSPLPTQLDYRPEGHQRQRQRQRQQRQLGVLSRQDDEPEPIESQSPEPSNADESVLPTSSFEPEAVDETKLPTPTASPYDWKIGRHFSVSTRGEMRNILRSDPEFVDNLGIVQRYLEQVEKNISNGVAIGKNRSESDLVPCNSDGFGFKDSMKHYLDSRYLDQPDLSCITEYIGTLDFTDIQLAKALRKKSEALSKSRVIIADVILGNWSEAYAPYDFSYSTESQRCIINTVGAVRNKKFWYISNAITNAPATFNLRVFDRKYIAEFLRVNHTYNKTKQEYEYKLDQPLKFRIHERPKNASEEHPYVNDTTTILSSVRGSVDPSFFGRMYMEDIPSLNEALDKSDLYIQQSNDALAPSNIALLVLPLFLNLIPLALFQPVITSSYLLLTYTLMTDIVTVLPLGIKGIELINIGKTVHYATSVRMTSAVDGSLSSTAAAQMWTCECRAKRNILPAGILFVCLSIIFMILGVLLEIIARSIMTKYIIRNIQEENSKNPNSGVFKSYEDQNFSIMNNGDIEPNNSTLSSSLHGLKSGYDVEKIARANDHTHVNFLSHVTDVSYDKRLSQNSNSSLKKRKLNSEGYTTSDNSHGFS